mmetsp:Transcript_72569/g.156959  ORF Transcript_72569/g.156959 Transcript_72569/m.156959 type:complete len:851 (+) Transcript_72569:500-3052(+)
MFSAGRFSELAGPAAHPRWKENLARGLTPCSSRRLAHHALQLCLLVAGPLGAVLERLQVLEPLLQILADGLLPEAADGLQEVQAVLRLLLRRGVLGVLEVVGQVLELLPHLRLLLVLDVLGGELVGLRGHLRERGRVQSLAGPLDAALGLRPRLLVHGRDVQDAVRVEREAHLDLGLALLGALDVADAELPEEAVAADAGVLALVHADLDAGLVVHGGRVAVGLLARDRGVLGDDDAELLALDLDAEAARRHVEEHEGVAGGVPDAGEDGALHGGAVGHGLVGVDGPAQLPAAKGRREGLLDLGDARGAADEHDVVDVLVLELGVLEHLLHGVEGALEDGLVQGLELLPAQLEGVILELDLRAVAGGERPLRLLHGRAELPHQLVVALEVLDLVLEDGAEVLHDRVVEVLAAQVRVAARGQDLEHALLDPQHAHVEGASAEVVDEDVRAIHVLPLLGALLLVEAVGERRRGRLVDDAQDVQAGDRAGGLRRRALRVVEVGRHGHHGLLHRVAETRLGDALHVGQHEAADLLRRHELPVERLHLDPGVVGLLVRHDLEGEALDLVPHRVLAHLLPQDALDVVERVLRVPRRLGLRRLAHEAGAVRREGDEGGGRAVAAVVLEDLDAAALPHGDAAEGGAQVDADHHGVLRVVGGGRGLLLLLLLREALLLLLGGGGRVLQPLNHHLVLRVHVQALLEGLHGLLRLHVGEQRGAEARVALRPVRLERDALVGVGDGVARAQQLEVGARAVRVEDVVGVVHLDRAGEQAQGVEPVAGREGRVALVLQLLGGHLRHLVRGHPGRRSEGRALAVGARVVLAHHLAHHLLPPLLGLRIMRVALRRHREGVWKTSLV